MSSAIETDPVGVPDVQPAFLNAAAVGDTTLGPRRFLSRSSGHRDSARDASVRSPAPPGRWISICILFGTTILHESQLEIPHPRFRERRFVLEPLAAIAPDLRDPVTSLTIAELLARLPPAT